MKAGSLCSGYGGLDLAVSAVLGSELAWVAEFDPDASRVLARNYPGVENLGDITKVDWFSVASVDITAVGFPCQDVSAAGKRAGLKPGTRVARYKLIPAALRPFLDRAELLPGCQREAA